MMHRRPRGSTYLEAADIDLDPVPGPAQPSAPVVYLAIVAALFFVAAHDFYVPLTFVPGFSTNDLGTSLDAISEGSPRRRAAFLILGLSGAFMLLRDRHRTVNVEPLVLVPAILFAAWSTLSIVWAEDVMLTLRRLVVFWLLVVAVSALVRSTPRRAIPAFIGLSSAVYLLIGIANELRLGTFAPFVSDYRFAGTLHPNHQGVNCAMLALSGVWYLSSRQARWRALAVGFVVFGVAFLLLTKSRTAFATFVGAALLVPVLQLRPRRRFIVATVIVNLGILLLLLYWYGALDPLLELFLLGRGGQDLGSLNSRLPLWRLLWDYAAERPLLGYGYSGFMTERHAAEIAVLERFGVAGAHSLYLEVMLGVGLVGLSFLLATFIMAIVTGFRDSGREIPSPEALFVAILVYELLNGILESTILMPSWRLIPLIVLGTLCLAPGATAPVRRR